MLQAQFEYIAFFGVIGAALFIFVVVAIRLGMPARRRGLLLENGEPV
jgi:hypothetical protein